MTEIQSTSAAKITLNRTVKHAVKTILTPAPRLQLSQWANEHRYLSREFSSEPGKFRWERAPYMREMLDVAGDYRTQRMVIMSSAQIGKTTVLENIIAYFIACDPSPILLVLPELTTAKAFSTDRLDPMLRDSPILKGRVKEKRSRDSGNTLLQKRFIGGHLTIIGANSASGLRSRPIRVLLMDEVDAYPVSAGKEGDPVNLAVARTSNFWNRKIILTSTPTVTDLSRIEKEFKTSDQRYYHVPCPHCNELDKLTWSRIKYDDGNATTAYCVCLKCGAVIQDEDKGWMLKHGVWIAENPTSSVAGFHLSALYSPWRTWKELVAQWLEDKKSPETLKVFINTVLGETWDDAGERVESHHLATRLEAYPAEVPAGVGVLTCGVDVQGDWIEGYVWGWGHREESWFIDRFTIVKDPGTDAAWIDVEAQLRKRYKTVAGGELGIRVTAIDTGHQSERVHRFVKHARQRGIAIHPVKGSSIPDFPLFRKTERVLSVGTNTAKDLIHSRMKIQAAGAGYIHLPTTIDLDVLDQLTAERRIIKYNKAGHAFRVWENPHKLRNEALDCYVYSMVALASLGPNVLQVLGKVAEKVSAQGNSDAATDGDNATEAAQTPPASTPTRRITPRRPLRSGWASGFTL